MLKSEDLIWLGIDLDKTLAHNDEDFNLLEPIEGAKESLEELQSAGYKVIIYTARPWAEYQLVEEWLDNYAIPYNKIVCGKPLFRYIIDDKNIEFRNWQQVMEDLKHREANE